MLIGIVVLVAFWWLERTESNNKDYKHRAVLRMVRVLAATWQLKKPV